MPLRPVHSTKACVLVVDEDRQRGAHLQRLLVVEGFRLADEAGSAVRSIDLVIADIAPGRASQAVSPVIRRFGRTPVLALVDHAAWRGLSFLDAADALGAAAILQRPFPRAALLRSIAAVLSQPPVPDDADFGRRCGSPEFILGGSSFA